MSEKGTPNFLNRPSTTHDTKNLSEQELESQMSRDVYEANARVKALGLTSAESDPNAAEKVGKKIHGDALNENLNRAEVNERLVNARAFRVGKFDTGHPDSDATLAEIKRARKQANDAADLSRKGEENK